MRSSRIFFSSLTLVGFLLSLVLALPLPAQAPREPTELERRVARHFSERPPVLFEFVAAAVRGPFIIITNSYQFALTAYVVQTEPKSGDDSPQTLICDALTRVCGLAPIPRGLSHKMSVPHLVGGLVPDAKLAAVVWEDGSTFGPDELLVRIQNNRTALADSYDRAVITLQTGLDKNWTPAEYLTAARQLQPSMPASTAATPEEARPIGEKFSAATLPGYTIKTNMEHAVQHDRSPAQVARLAQSLLKEFMQARDSLRVALGGQIASASQTSNP
jgi:hypothetical protein